MQVNVFTPVACTSGVRPQPSSTLDQSAGSVPFAGINLSWTPGLSLAAYGSMLVSGGAQSTKVWLRSSRAWVAAAACRAPGAWRLAQL